MKDEFDSIHNAAFRKCPNKMAVQLFQLLTQVSSQMEIVMLQNGIPAEMAKEDVATFMRGGSGALCATTDNPALQDPAIIHVLYGFTQAFNAKAGWLKLELGKLNEAYKEQIPRIRAATLKFQELLVNKPVTRANRQTLNAEMQVIKIKELELNERKQVIEAKEQELDAMVKFVDAIAGYVDYLKSVKKVREIK